MPIEPEIALPSLVEMDLATRPTSTPKTPLRLERVRRIREPQEAKSQAAPARMMEIAALIFTR
jgi:hypothetical protein